MNTTLITGAYSCSGKIVARELDNAASREVRDRLRAGNADIIELDLLERNI